MYYTYVRSHGNLFGRGGIALADRESKRTKIFKHVVHNLFGIRLGIREEKSEETRGRRWERFANEITGFRLVQVSGEVAAEGSRN